MSNATVSPLGQANATGSTNALFLKLYSGEILAKFQRENKMMGLVNTRNISSGKSTSYPLISSTTAGFHTAGTEILGNAIKHNEKEIFIDDMLLASSFVSEIDELKNHFEIRGEYARQMGEALAKSVDQRLLQLAVLASQTGDGITGSSNGHVITDADCKTNATSMIASIFEAIQKLDEKDVPESDRVVIVTPDVYYQLANVDKLVSRDFSSNNGDFSKGQVVMVGGVRVVKSTTAISAWTDHSADATTGTNNTYNVDAQYVGAVVMHKSALGVVKLKDLVLEVSRDPRRLGSLITARMAIGAGILRSESAISIVSQ